MTSATVHCKQKCVCSPLWIQSCESSHMFPCRAHSERRRLWAASVASPGEHNLMRKLSSTNKHTRTLAHRSLTTCFGKGGILKQCYVIRETPINVCCRPTDKLTGRLQMCWIVCLTVNVKLRYTLFTFCQLQNLKLLLHKGHND